MVQPLSSLGTTQIPDASQVTGTQMYAEAYSAAYKRIATGIMDAVTLLRSQYGHD